MAEVGSDISLSRPTMLHNPHDEDLIDYEEEIIGEISDETETEAALKRPDQNDEVATEVTEVHEGPSASSHQQDDAAKDSSATQIDQGMEQISSLEQGDDPDSFEHMAQPRDLATSDALVIEHSAEAESSSFAYNQDVENVDGADMAQEDLADPYELEIKPEEEDEEQSGGDEHTQGHERHGHDQAGLDDVEVADGFTADHDQRVKGDEEEEIGSQPAPQGDDEITWEVDEVDAEDAADQASAVQTLQKQTLAGAGAESTDAALDGALAPQPDAEEHLASPSQDAVINDGEQDFPAITVQYKGEEFPMFCNSEDGFFTHSAILDDSIADLLSSFRAELANEIVLGDELVFQIDELGLEYAESSTSECLSSVTLRQILEIFDLLVKNQDPDSSRILYTYLFSRPDATRRFESLAESAAAGKGLDEIIHLFRPPFLHGATSGGLGDDNDQYKSAGDVSADEVAELPEGDDPADYAGESSAVAEEGFEESYTEVQGGEALLEDSGQQEQDKVVDYDEYGASNSPKQPLAGTDDIVPTDPNSNVAFESEDSRTVGDGDFDVGVDFVKTPAGDDPEPNEGTTGSSMVEITDQDMFAIDPPAEADLVQSQTNRGADGVDEELAEIDWRDEPAADARSNGSLSTSKRPRDDDELDVEDENDAKRQRS